MCSDTNGGFSSTALSHASVRRSILCLFERSRRHFLVVVYVEDGFSGLTTSLLYPGAVAGIVASLISS